MAPLEPLSKAAHDWAVRSYINQGLQAGQSVTSLYEASKGTEWAMRKSDFLAIGRELKGVERSRSIIASTPNKYLLGEAVHETARLGINDTYRYTVKAQMESALTGEKTDRWAYIDGSERLSKDEIEAEVVDSLVPASEVYGESLVSFKVVTALRKGG